MNSDQTVKDLFCSLGLRVLNTSYLGKGEGSYVLKIETDQGIFTLKFPLYPERKKKILREIEIRNYFIDQGITCIPLPFYSDETFFTNGAAIYRYIEGIHPDFKNPENLKQMAKILSKLHQIDYKVIEDGFEQIEKLYFFLEETISRISSKYSHLMNSSIESAFSKALVEYETKIRQNKDLFTIGINARLHGDISDNSVIDSKGNIWLVDWENSEYGDVVDELCGFLYVNEVSKENQAEFLSEYQKKFKLTQRIRFDEIIPIYFASVPVCDICWGIDQLDMNLRHNLEPERKLRDLKISANEWKQFYSDTTSILMIEGIERLNEQYKSH